MAPGPYLHCQQITVNFISLIISGRNQYRSDTIQNVCLLISLTNLVLVLVCLGFGEGQGHMSSRIAIWPTIEPSYVWGLYLHLFPVCLISWSHWFRLFLCWYNHTFDEILCCMWMPEVQRSVYDFHQQHSWQMLQGSKGFLCAMSDNNFFVFVSVTAIKTSMKLFSPNLMTVISDRQVTFRG